MTDLSEEDIYKELQGRLHALYSRPGFKVRRLRQISESIFNEACAEFSITTTQFGVLYTLNAIDDLDQITVARLIGLDRSTAGLVIELLESRGLINRNFDPADRRRRILTITAEGRELIEKLQGPAQKSIERFLDSLSRKDQKRFLGLLGKSIDDDNSGEQMLVYQAKISALLQRPGILIRRLHQKSEALFVEECRDQQLTPTQYGLLHVVRQCGPVDQITMARLIAVDRSTVALVVRLLVERGLISKSVDTADKRRRTLVITPEGLDLFQAAASSAARVMNALLASLPDDDRKWLMSTLDKLINRHEARFSTVPQPA